MSEEKPTARKGIGTKGPQGAGGDYAVPCGENYFRALVENALDIVQVVNRNGTVRYESPAILQMTGYSSEERVGESALALLHEDDIERARSAMSGVLKNPASSVRMDMRLRHKDGSHLHVDVEVRNLLDDPDVAGLVVSVRDITELKRTEDDLRIKESALENSINAIAMTNMEGRITYVNRACMTMWGGGETGDLVGKPYWVLIQSQGIAGDVAIAMAEDQTWQGELIAKRKDGVEITVQVSTSVVKDERGNPIHTVSSLVDITEANKAEKALRESEALFRTIFEGAANGMALVSLEGKPLMLNPALVRLLGHDPGGFSSLEKADYLYQEDAMTDAALFLEMVAGERNHYEVEKRYVRKDGKVVWAHQTISLVRDAEGLPQFVVAMIEDITGRKNAEEEKLRLEDQILLAGRLAAVGELAAGVAHELNNPLAAVQAFAQLLVSRSDLDDSVKADLQTIYSESQRATKITGNLLSFARRHRPENVYVSMNEVIQKSLDLHAYQMRLSCVEVAKDFDPDLPETMADPHQMQQVFVNLIQNAEQAMTKANKGGWLCIRTETEGDVIRLTFSDNGPGISDADLGSIFDPFFTTKDVGEGTGLGLSICYGIVESHGGRIHARSEPGKGTAFVVEMPVSSREDIVRGECESSERLMATSRSVQTQPRSLS